MQEGLSRGPASRTAKGRAEIRPAQTAFTRLTGSRKNGRHLRELAASTPHGTGHRKSSPPGAKSQRRIPGLQRPPADPTSDQSGKSILPPSDLPRQTAHFRAAGSSRTIAGQDGTIRGLTQAVACPALAVAAAVWALPALSAVCSNTPAANERVECTEDSTSTDDIELLLEGIDIDVTATVVNTHAVRAKHEGSGDIRIEVTLDIDDSGEVVRSTIDTSGTSSQAYAIYGEHRGTGAIDVSVSTTTTSTTGRSAHGVHARHYGTGPIRFDVSNSRIDTKAGDAHGIFAVHHSTDTGDDADADIRITAAFNNIVTEGKEAHAVRATKHGHGDLTIKTTSNTIVTKGKEAFGIYGYHRGEGDILITSMQDTIATENVVKGEDSFAVGIVGWHQRGNGDTKVKVVGGSIKTVGRFSPGIYGVHGLSSAAPVTTKGAVDIDAEDTVIETAGRWSYAIYASHSGSGAIRVVTRGSQRTTTTGADAHGIVAYQFGAGEDRSIDITVGGTVDVKGPRADGVRVGRVWQGNADRAAAFDEDGYRRHTVRVNGRIVSAAGAGVFLAGGGKVFIGPSGRIDAKSGIAILATGDTPADSQGDPAIKPKLLVNMQLDGRRVGAVLGDGWIINDGGETTIVVNGVKLHDGATGVVPGAVAANGVWDVTIREAGTKVTDRTDADPANWIISEPAKGVIADRDFSTDDFVGSPRHPEITEMYGPRAAVYEALPGFLLRLNAPDSRGTRIPSQELAGWVRRSGGGGTYEPERASVGATFGFGRRSLEAGLDVPLGDGAVGMVSVRSILGSADVSAMTGGGRIEASGLGPVLGLYVGEASGSYARGTVSYTEYILDLESATRGSLEMGVGARGLSLDLEVGRRLALGDTAFVTPRVRATVSKVDIEGFTDALGSRVSAVAAFRHTGSIGLVAGTGQRPGSSGGTFGLWGSLDLERVFDSAGTRILVSGEELRSEPSRTGLNVAFGGSWHRDELTVEVSISVLGIGSGDSRHSGQVTIVLRF